MERRGGGRRGGILSDDTSHEGRKVALKTNTIIT
jgi:hypothetical protein